MLAGFDLGQNCGFALLDDDGQRISSGTVNLGKRSGKSLRGFSTLVESVLMEGVTAVCYEIVRRHRGVHAAHAYGGYEAILWMTCHDLGIPTNHIIGATVQQIKRCATGDGHAEKEDIEAQAMARWCYMPEDDNEADSLWCAEVARRMLNGEDI